MDAYRDNHNSGQKPGRGQVETPQRERGGSAARHAAASPLLEYLRNTVTREEEREEGLEQHFEVAKCRCDCWFCPDCCAGKGYNLRARLIPILETFKGLMMLTFTVDPTLFATPKDAYRYICKRRCLGRTLQDLDRAGYLHTRRYFYVVEFQKNTEQAHFHVLIDATFVPFDALLASWSKHRPKDAGPVVGDRPPFGTVLFSKRDFADAVHAARYATKYLVKTPDYGYPAWVMAMGTKQRVRRYSTSRGFWNNPSQPKREPQSKRTVNHRTYAQRIESCGDTVQLFSLTDVVDVQTGEVTEQRQWIGKLGVDSSVLDQLHDEGDPRRRRRIIEAPSVHDAVQIIESVAGHPVEWIQSRSGTPSPRADEIEALQ
jgi:hypothetical protein